jgi:hypothetical protein
MRNYARSQVLVVSHFVSPLVSFRFVLSCIVESGVDYQATIYYSRNERVTKKVPLKEDSYFVLARIRVRAWVNARIRLRVRAMVRLRMTLRGLGRRLGRW